MSGAPTPPPPTASGDQARIAQMRLGAFVMLTLGGLITLLCGSCTLLFLVPTLAAVLGPSSGGAGAQEMLAFSVIPLVLGGIPTLAGILLLAIGWRTLRRANAAAKTSAAETFT